MDAKSAVRVLAPSEESFAHLFGGFSLYVRGELNYGVLTSAFDAVRSKYPVLGAHLEAVDGGHMIVGASAPLPGVSVCDGEVGQPLAGVHPDPGIALCELHVVRDGDQASVTLLIHHSIADARHLLAVLDDLWSFYTDIAHGNTVTTARQAYPESLEKLLADRGIRRLGSTTSRREHRVDGGGNRTGSRALPVTGAAPGPGDCTESQSSIPALLRCRLSVKETSVLLKFARYRQVTVNGLVSAAVIRAEGDVQRVPLTQVTYAFEVDLRSRLTPPVTGTAATNMLGRATFTATTDTTDLVELAHAVSERLHADLVSGSICRNALEVGPRVSGSVRAGAGEVPDAVGVTASNVGKVTSLRAPGTLHLHDLRPAAYRDVAMASERGRLSRPPFYVITYFGGRLNIEMPVFDRRTIESAHARMAALGSYLHSIS